MNSKWDNELKMTGVQSVALEHDILGQIVEIVGLVKHDGNLRVDLFASFPLHVLLSDGLEIGQPVL